MVEPNSTAAVLPGLLIRLSKRSGLTADRLRTTDIDVAPLLELPPVVFSARRAGTDRADAAAALVRGLAAHLPPTELLIVDAELALGLLSGTRSRRVDPARLYSPELGARRRYLLANWQLLHEAVAAEHIPRAPSGRALRDVHERRAFTTLAHRLAVGSDRTTPVDRPELGQPVRRVTVIGEAAIEHIYRVAELPGAGTVAPGMRVQHPGGPGLSRAAAVRRLGLATRLVTGVGDDPAGHSIQQYLSANDIHHDLVHTVPGAVTAVHAITIDRSGRTSVISCADPWLRDQPIGTRAAAVRTALSSSHAILLATPHPTEALTQILPLIRHIPRRPPLILDLVPDSAPSPALPESLDRVDYLIGTVRELTTLLPGADPRHTHFGSAFERRIHDELLARGLGTVCVLDGSACHVRSARSAADIMILSAGGADAYGARMGFTAALTYRVANARGPVQEPDFRWAAAAMEVAGSARGARVPDSLTPPRTSVP